MKSGYLIRGCISRIRAVDLEKELIREPVGCRTGIENVFAMDWFRSPGDMQNSLVLVSGSGEEGGRLWVVKVLRLGRICDREGNEGQAHPFFSM